jgi:hypothetical protein
MTLNVAITASSLLKPLFRYIAPLPWGAIAPVILV